MLATQMGMTEAHHQSQLVWIVQIWPIFASQQVDSAGTHAKLCFGLLVSCYSLLQYSRPAWLELFVDHTYTHSMNNLRWQPHWLPDWRHFQGSHITDGEPKAAVSASLQKRKSIKNQHFFFFFFFFNIFFIKSQTSNSFVNHFNGHFAYLKTWDFSFKRHLLLLV